MTLDSKSTDEFFVLYDVLNVLTMLKQTGSVFHIVDIDTFVHLYGNPYVQSNNVYEQNLCHIVCKHVVFHLLNVEN